MNKKRTAIRNKTYRRIAAICAILVAALLLSITLATPGYIKRHLNDYIFKSSKGEYGISFSGISANLYTRTIVIDSLQLIPLKKDQNHYAVYTSNLKATGVSPIAFLLHHRLKIDRLVIRKPKFEIIGSDGLKRDTPNRDELFSRLRPFLNRSLKGITIREIRLEQAYLAHYGLQNQNKALSSVNDLEIGIRNFKLDSTVLSRGDEFFHADDIFVRIVDFNRLLGDSLHRVHVHELTYSIEQNNITGKDFSLQPINDSTKIETRYWIDIPTIKLKSNNLRDIIGNDSVWIDSVQIAEANIRIKPGVNSRKLSFRDLKQYDLYDLVRNDFNFIKINYLHLHANQLKFEPRTPAIDNTQILSGIDAEAENFELDSSGNYRLDKILYADQISLKVNAYSLKLNDQVHRFEASNIEVSSRDSMLKAEALRLTPSTEKHKLQTTVELQTDSIRIGKVNLSRLFHFREMPMDELSIYSPKVTVNQHSNEIGKQQDEESLLYQFIRDYIKGVYANVIAINQGHIVFNDYRNARDDGHLKVDFDFNLTDFMLDSVSARQTEKLFFATNFDLTFSNYQMQLADQLHILQVEKIAVSSLQQLATIQDLHLFPDKSKNARRMLERLNRSELYEIEIPKLQLQHTDIHHAFFRKSLNINRFTITNPKIYFEVFAHQRQTDEGVNLEEFYGLLQNYIEEISIEQIALENGELQFINHSRKGRTINLKNDFSLNLDQFRLNREELHSNRMLFSDNFELKIKDHLFKLSDNVHFLKASEISLSSSKSEGIIHNALLFPELSSPDYDKLPWHIQISVPKIRLNKIDLAKAVFNEILDVGSVEVESPVIQVYRNREGDDKFNFKDLTIPLPEELKELNLDQVSLTNGKLIMYKNSRTNKTQLAGSSVSLSLLDVKLKRTADNKTARFSAKDIDTRLTNLTLSPTKVPYVIHVKDIDFSSGQKKLELNELQIEHTGTSPDQVISIQFPHLKFEQLDPTDAFDHNRFHASRILVDNPVFNLREKESKQRQNPLYIKLSPDLNAIMDELSAGKVLVNNATFNFFGRKHNRKLNSVDIEMNDVMLDSTLSEKPLGAEDLTIIRRNMQYTDKHNLYDLRVDQLAYSTRSNNLTLSGLHIIPRFGPDDFQKQISFQQDYYSGDVKQLNVGNIDLDKWFKDRELIGENVAIEQANLLIYRDKRVDIDPNRFPPMLQDVFRKIEMPFYFDTLKLNRSTIIYSEQAIETPEPGRVSFEQLEAELYPFTNLRQSRFIHPNIYLNASAKLMGASELKAGFKFDMNSPVNRFEAEGSLAPFDLTAMNPITENGASISVRSGQLNRFEFEFSGDSVAVNGKLRFAYEDLKISILAYKNGNTKEAKFLSFLANSLMLKSKSPRTRFLLPDDIRYYRDPNKSTLNYWWKAVFSGAKNTFGVKEDTDE
ncbi:hypothetical protein [Mangrovibacterium sp.]|uniref:hypothetical protein n=1 Tax=Mangrovibacterium sp. TaxID=1961364 RepID=UPI0035693813